MVRGSGTMSGKPLDDSFVGFKLRTYAVILSVGLLGATSAWLTNELAGTITLFTRAIFVLIIALAAAAMWALATRRVPLRVVEEAVYVVVSGIMLAVLAYSLYGEPDPTLADLSLFSLHLWFPFVYIFIFIGYDSVAALTRSGILFGLSVAMSIPAMVISSESRLHSFSTLGLTCISMGSIIAVLYFLTRMKDQLRRSELAADRMKLLADTDPLTEILNRRGMKALMEQEIRRAAQEGTPLSLIIFDLDNFKAINDAYGHDVGDEVLVTVAGSITPHLRGTDCFARWGGEEFAILVPGAPLDRARLFADRLRTILHEYDSNAGWTLSASFGVSTYVEHDTMTTLAKRADVALYRAKRQGKNRTEIGQELGPAVAAAG